jgi:hypothetical protein
VIPFIDVEGKDGTTPPAQMVIEVPKLNEGVNTGLIVTVKPVAKAHCPGLGVKV